MWLGAAVGWAQQEPFPVAIRVDASRSLGELRQIWRFFGADEPNYATMKDGQRLLSDFGALRPGQVYFRAHNLLNTGDGTPALKWGSTNVYTEDEEGRPVYDWRILDLMFDSYLERHVRPYVEIGFMPQALSTHPEPYRHSWRPGFPYDRVFTGWSYPPTDYDKWEELVYQWAKHCSERYGADEVNHWYWETWNEANIGAADRPGYFTGTVEEFLKLHDHAIAGVRAHCRRPRWVAPMRRAAAATGRAGFWSIACAAVTLRPVRLALRWTSCRFMPRGRLVGWTIIFAWASQISCARSTMDLRLWHRFRNFGRRQSSLANRTRRGVQPARDRSSPIATAPCIPAILPPALRKHDLADRHGVNFEGALSWAFTFENQPYFAGFRQLASNGIPLPVFNVMRMFSKMRGQRIATDSDHAVPLDEMMRSGVRQQPDVAALASLDADARQLATMVWHYHDDDLPGAEATVSLQIAGLPGEVDQVRLTHYRIDKRHSNAYAQWLAMGSPVAPNLGQYERLQHASQLSRISEAPDSLVVAQGQANIEFLLPRQGVSLIMLAW